MPLSVLSKPWVLQPSRMELGAGPSCQGYTDSERCTVTPDGCLTRACPWSQGELARVIQHKLISSSQSLLAPCQGQELGPLMANISSSLLHSSASKMQMRTSQPTPTVFCSQRKTSLVPMTDPSYRGDLLCIRAVLTENQPLLHRHPMSRIHMVSACVEQRP